MRIILGVDIGGSTTKIVAFQNVDRVLALEDGELVATGTHTELYRTCPAYRRAVDLQKLEEEGGDYANA